MISFDAIFGLIMSPVGDTTIHQPSTNHRAPLEPKTDVFQIHQRAKGTKQSILGADSMTQSVCSMCALLSFSDPLVPFLALSGAQGVTLCIRSFVCPFGPNLFIAINLYVSGSDLS